MILEDVEADIKKADEQEKTAIEEGKESRLSSKGELDSVMEKIKVDEPGCEFMTINFPVRLKNRQLEIDGLLKAKAILQGGSFDEGPDPNREIKPGDAM